MKVKQFFRDTVFLAVIIVGIYLLFAFQSVLMSVDLTGDVIQVGKPDEEKIVIDPGKPPASQQPKQPVDAKTQCWIDRGIREEDFLIAGNLLNVAPCSPARGRKPVTASVMDNCVNVVVGSEAATRLCIAQDKPQFSLEFPTGGSGTVQVLSARRSYAAAIFAVIFLLLILFVWGRTDLEQYRYKRKVTRGYSTFLPGTKEIEIRYITPPPRYQKKGEEKLPVSEKSKNIEKILLPPLSLKQPRSVAAPAEAPQKKPMVSLPALSSLPTPTVAEQQPLASPLNKRLVAFNQLSQQMSEELAASKFGAAEQSYQDLFRLSIQIYPAVSQENKQRLLKVVTMLHQQLAQLRKAQYFTKQLKQAYREEEQKPYRPQVWRSATKPLPAEQVSRLDEELTKLRHFLERSRHEEAAHHFKKRFQH